MSAVHPPANEPDVLNHRWPRRAILACFAAALILGTAGYKIYEPKMHPMDALYHTVQLFAMHGPHLEHEVPWQLQWARWLAAAATVAAGAGLCRRMWREEKAVRRMQRMSGHTIVCGLGQKGMAVVRWLRAHGTPVVAIESAPTPAAAAVCGELDVHLVAGDAASPEVLQSARIAHARQVIAICPDDSTNCNIAAHVCRLGAAAGRIDPIQCRIQVGDAEMRQTLQNLLARRDDTRGAVVRFFDCFDPEARHLLVHELPLDHGGVCPDDARQVHLVVLGLGRMGRALVLRAAQLGVFANGRRLKISVVDRLAHSHRDELLFRCPQILQVCDIEFHNIQAASPETRGLLAQWCSDAGTITSVAVCFQDEQCALEIALQLRHLTTAGSIPVAVRMSGQSGIARLLGEAGAAPEFPIHPFGIEDRAAYMGAVGEDSDGLFARKIHAAYLKMRREDAGKDAEKLRKLAADPAMKEWDELGEDFRESNRQQHAHHHVKMRAIGCDIVPEGDDREAVMEFEPDEIEMLSKMEHRRWMAEKLIAGWIFAPGKKNGPLRTNPSLIPWNDLGEEVRDYDRTAVRSLPKLLSGAGRKICRRNQCQTSFP